MNSSKKQLPRWLIVILTTALPVLVGLISLYAREMSAFDSVQTLVLDRTGPAPLIATFSIPYWHDLVFIGLTCAAASIVATSKTVAQLLERLRDQDVPLANLGTLLLMEFVLTLLAVTFISGLNGIALASLMTMTTSALFGLVFGGFANTLPAEDRETLVTFPLSGLEQFTATCVAIPVIALIPGVTLTAALTLSFILTSAGPLMAAVTAAIVSVLAGTMFFIGLLPGLAVLTMRVVAAKITAKS